MSFNINWDVDQYKTEHESEEHWHLRRSFMLAHKDKFPEDRLVCLAQVFTNTEFLGCRYPEETMRLVASLAQGVADGYHEKQKGRLRRTFVQASDAAGAKAKGLKRPLQGEGPLAATLSHQAEKSAPHFDPKTTVTVDARLQNHFASKSKGDVSTLAKVTFGPSIFATTQAQNPQISAPPNCLPRVDHSRYGGVKTYHIDQASTARPPQSTGPEIGGPFGKLVLIEPSNQAGGALNTLQMSTSMCQVPMRFVYGKRETSEVSCDLYINEKLLTSSLEENKRTARQVAAEEGLQKLKETHYTIQLKLKFLSDITIDKSMAAVSCNSNTECADVSVPVADSNVGNRLLRLMGWTGGGLGKDAQGIEEPVRIQQNIKRTGLGLLQPKPNDSYEHQFREKVQHLIRDYAKGNSQYDLVFSSEFTTDERKIMHSIAMGLRLKTKSYGKDEDRHLVISKKRDVWQMLEQLLRNGGSTERYELVMPTGSEPQQQA